ncbi:hypothetical protein CASFOL_041000 [Castilleja foliolosa]|uniref:NB-ARC domain-containing protein n=1 Tax=Castilleja foliolosa TaxID=1961234 RepID=A0ABD3BDK7_9LAMI
MDDVRTVEDWDRLQIALLKSNKRGKVLITSRHVEVAHFANRDRRPHRLSGRVLVTSDEIAMSYDKLPYHLRACFLYFGMFPEDFEIPVWNLIRMWIAEGFVQEKDGSTLEETAESYLEDLVNRNLVYVDKKKHDGRPKTCRIHDMLREFCITEGGNDGEKFLQEMKKSNDGGFEPPVSEVQKYRRLCVHSDVVNFISSKPYGPYVRSFVSFSKEITLETHMISGILEAFKLLRVLEAKQLEFSRFPSNMYQLVHLSQYVGNDSDQKLQTLGPISPQSCTEEVFERTPSLKRLGICKRLALLLEGKSGSFDNFVNLSSLEKLKLRNDVFPTAPLEGKLLGLPQHYKFPPNLKSLTLLETYLDWSHMSILGLLDNLEVLKLKEKAFMGKCWEGIEGGFRRLKVLHIERTDLVVWVASQHHFPRLRRLELKNCKDLREIPIGLANIPSLQLLDVLYCKFAVIASAKKIRDVIETRQKEEQTANVGKFKLIIFPPDK